jgi:hypothetical protein
MTTAEFIALYRRAVSAPYDSTESVDCSNRLYEAVENLNIPAEERDRFETYCLKATTFECCRFALHLRCRYCGDPFIETVATIDGSDEEFPCVVNPDDRWNGFARPYFTAETLSHIFLNLQVKLISSQETHNDGTEDYWQECIVVNGQPQIVYFISGWTWSIKEDWEDSKWA